MNYKEVMSQYKLGPNGGIMTSLNLFTTRFNQVLNFVETRKHPCCTFFVERIHFHNFRLFCNFPRRSFVIIDTPRQIEIFTWSASGSIISESLASTFPTVVAYVVDTPRCKNPMTFMSNMLCACSILYKCQLPFILVFNKTDMTPHEFAVQWMRDYESYEAALRCEDSYASTLNRSMSLLFEEFYSTLNCIGVSALTGLGMPGLFVALNHATNEFVNEYWAELQKKRKAKEDAELVRQQQELEKLRIDLEKSGGQRTVTSMAKKRPEEGDIEDADDDDDEMDEEEDSDE
eukprot:c20552_g1_i6.p1 GENE.c20552_g1_i6~~c20552_g1_i6.p1  ORF type:complete len:289 (+),score=64.02 c20552_g1_i6:151-1017(+)